MRTGLRDKPPIGAVVPPGITQVDGDWVYNEYLDGSGIQSLDVEQRGFWDRLFGPSPSAPAPAPQQPSPADDLYRG